MLPGPDGPEIFTSSDIRIGWRQCYSTEWVLPAAWQRVGLVTNDAHDATIFLIPHASTAWLHSCLATGGNGTTCYSLAATHLSMVLDYVETFPYFATSGGRDHVLVFGHDGALASFANPPGRQLNTERLRWTIQLQNQGNRLSAKVFEPYRHIVTMPFATPSDSFVPANDPPFPTTLAYFSGGLHGRHRAEIYAALRNEINVEFLLERDPSYLEKLASKARTCLHLSGWDGAVWSGRLAHILLQGCIPSIVTDNLALPFERVVNWPSFALFFSENEAARPGFLVQRLTDMSEMHWRKMRQMLMSLRPVLTYSFPDVFWRPNTGSGHMGHSENSAYFTEFRLDAAFASYLEVLSRHNFGEDAINAAIDRAVETLTHSDSSADLFRCLFASSRFCTSPGVVELLPVQI